jgi:hypothetical protein
LKNYCREILRSDQLIKLFPAIQKQEGQMAEGLQLFPAIQKQEGQMAEGLPLF